jgi:AcrR family transcriptional regulator
MAVVFQHIRFEATTVTTDGSVREQILDAALRVMQEGGPKKLSQPRVAAAAGVRQSHVTYYFPRRTDLVIALLEGHVAHAAERLAELDKNEEPEDIRPAIETLINDRRRMRFFMGLIIEADADAKLRRLVDAHIAQVNAMVARYYGRADDDRDVEAFLNALRGYGMVNMVQSDDTPRIDVAALARRFGLVRGMC